MTLCSPWLTADDISLCSTDVDQDSTVEPSDLNIVDKAIWVASSWLYSATAQQYPGICTDNIRPCATASGWAQPVDYPPNIGGARALRELAAPCAGMMTSIVCDGMVWPAVELPGLPVVDVVELTIDGIPFFDFRIVDDRWLIRQDAGVWPSQQNLGLEITEPGTWGIEYRWGSAPPPDLVHGAEVLTCELIKGWCPDGSCGECRLPQRLIQATFEGATMAVLDPFEFLGEGRFGILEVDGAIVQHNPNRLQRNGRLVTTDDLRRAPFRVR